VLAPSLFVVFLSRSDTRSPHGRNRSCVTPGRGVGEEKNQRVRWGTIE
jgi:hypothetical protein